MGLSSKKETRTNDPSAYAKPQIDAAGGALSSAYNSVQPTIANISSTLGSNLNGLAEKAFGTDPNLGAATDYNTSVLGGQYLDAGNPYLAGIANDTAEDVTGRVNSQFGAAGRTGSGANQLALTKGLASARNGLYAQQYEAERGRMGQAAALAPALNASQYTGLGAYLSAAQGAVSIPTNAANNYASGLGSLYSQYNKQTGTYTPSIMDSIGQAINVGTSVAGLFPGKGG